MFWAWGRNDRGQLGDMTTEDREYPIQVFKGDSYGNGYYLENISQISAKANNTAVIDRNSRVYAWGDNTSQQLGDYTLSADYASTPRKVYTTYQYDPNYELANVMAISVGFEHMLSIDYDGNVAIWGKVIDDNGAFTVYDRANGVVAGETGTVTGLASLGDISLIATGKNFSVAMSNSGNIAAWGIGDYGEIGNSGFSSFNYPVYTGEKSAENYRFEIGQITTNQGDVKEDYDGSSEFFLAPSKITISQKEKYVVNPTRAIRTVLQGI